MIQKTTKEIILDCIPKDCIWEDMNNLTNCPMIYVSTAMSRFAEQEVRVALSARSEYNDSMMIEFAKFYHNHIMETSKPPFNKPRMGSIELMLEKFNSEQADKMIASFTEEAQKKVFTDNIKGTFDNEFRGHDDSKTGLEYNV